jgi:hypothetical protein
MSTLENEVQMKRPNIFWTVVKLSGGPIFVLLAILIPKGALVTALMLGSLAGLGFVHVMTGLLWTGADLFMGVVIGPVMKKTAPEQKAEFFKALIPKMTFIMPMLAGVSIVSGIILASRLGMLTLEHPLMIYTWVITAGLVVLGFGFLLPNEIRIFKQLVSDTPDKNRVARLGMQNAKLSGAQGAMQVAIILVMANIRF